MSAWQRYLQVYPHFCVKVQGLENGCQCLMAILFTIRYLISNVFAFIFSYTTKLKSGFEALTSSNKESNFCAEQTFLTPFSSVYANYLDIMFAMTWYCKFGNFCLTFISQIFNFEIISQSLNLQTNTYTI